MYRHSYMYIVTVLKISIKNIVANLNKFNVNIRLGLRLVNGQDD